MEAAAPRRIIACRIMQRELDLLCPDDASVQISYLHQELHRSPTDMAHRIQEEVDRVAGDAEQIVLGYGLCANGVVGVAAPRQWLIVPKIHDCISMFLGSRWAYESAFLERPGTYYLTTGWIAEAKDPIGVLERDYVPRLGREAAEEALHEEFKHYSHIAVVNEGGEVTPELRARAKENAWFLDKEYIELQGSDAYFSSIVHGPYDEDSFLVLPPGERVRQMQFFT
jgi:hypothetical protein